MPRASGWGSAPDSSSVAGDQNASQRRHGPTGSAVSARASLKQPFRRPPGPGLRGSAGRERKKPRPGWGRGRGVLTRGREAGQTGPRAGVSGLRLPGSSLRRRRRPRHSCCLRAQPSQYTIPTLLGRAPRRHRRRLWRSFSRHLRHLPHYHHLLLPLPRAPGPPAKAAHNYDVTPGEERR